MQTRILVPSRADIGSIPQEETSRTSFSTWLDMIRQTLRWAVRRRQRHVFSVSCDTLPPSCQGLYHACRQ